MIQQNKQRGFTIIELMISMAFVALLLLATVAVSIAAAKIYNKGLTLRSLAVASRTIDDDLLREVSSSAPFAVEGPTTQFDAVTSAGIQESGRFCTGGVTYLWNTPMTGTSSQIVYDTGEPVQFTKIFDPGASLCQKVSGKYPSPKKAESKELLSDLRLYNLTVKQSQATTNGQAMYVLNYTIGSSDKDFLSISVNPDTGLAEYGCSIGKETSNNAFCGISSFTTVARAGNVAAGGGKQ